MAVAFCKFCGRDDVPICDECGHKLPHGVIPGTSSPCARCKLARGEPLISRPI